MAQGTVADSTPTPASVLDSCARGVRGDGAEVCGRRVPVIAFFGVQVERLEGDLADRVKHIETVR